MPDPALPAPDTGTRSWIARPLVAWRRVDDERKVLVVVVVGIQAVLLIGRALVPDLVWLAAALACAVGTARIVAARRRQAAASPTEGAS